MEANMQVFVDKMYKDRGYLPDFHKVMAAGETLGGKVDNHKLCRPLQLGSNGSSVCLVRHGEAVVRKGHFSPSIGRRVCWRK